MSMPTWFGAFRNGVYFDLTAAGIFWTEQGDGFGMPPMHRFTQRGPMQHGETNRDFRLDPRTITLIGGVVRACERDIYAARQRLLGIFRPSNVPILLRWDLSDGTVRQIDAYYSGGMSLPMGHPASGSGSGSGYSGQTFLHSQGVFQRTAVELFCPDPAFYDPTQKTATIANPDLGSGGFTVPMPVPFEVGSSQILSAGQTIAYVGTWDAYPVIRLYGPMSNIVLTQSATGEVLSFPTGTVEPGGWWDIDLGYAAKTVVDQDGVSQIDNIADDSDLATWHLTPAPDGTVPYNNIILFTADGTNADSHVRLSWYDRFVGF